MTILDFKKTDLRNTTLFAETILYAGNFGASNGIPPGREDRKIAQGETLGKCSTERYPPRRGGVKPLLGRLIQ
jgi:hypothetical protein